MSDLDSAIKAYYATRAPYYDDVYDKPERRNDLAFLKRHLPSRFAGQSVIEVACGTGYWTQYIAPVASRLVATDALAEPLDFAKQRPGVERVQFLQADAYSLPAELGKFQAAYAGLWFSHVPIERRPEFLTSLHHLLLPGATVIFLDNSEVQCREHPIVKRDAHGNTYQDRRLRDGSVHRVLKNFPSETELRQMVADAAKAASYKALENFWLFEYVLAGDRGTP